MVADPIIPINNLNIAIVPTHLSARCGNNYLLVQQFHSFTYLVHGLKAYLLSMIGEDVRS